MSGKNIIYDGLVKSSNPPVIKVTLRGFLGFSPKIQDWHVSFAGKHLEAAFQEIAAKGFPAGIRFKALVGGASSNAVDGVIEAKITEIIPV